MLEDMHDYYFSGIQFEAEEKTSFNEYIENYFPISEWETLPSDRYQKQMRSLMKNNTVKEVGAGIEKQKLGLSQSASPTERLMLAICAPDGQKQQVKSEDDLQKDLENLVLVTEICNGETSLDQQTAETLNASAWAMLLKKKPEYVKMCDTGKMSTADLMSILIQTPTIAKHLDVSRLTSMEWKQLVKNQVKLRPLAVKYQINQAS
jgi:hypothetical protein